MVYVETYKGEDHKQHQSTVEKIGYVDEFLDIYPDPEAHFREEAKKRTNELKEKEKNNIFKINNNESTKTRRQDRRLQFRENQACGGECVQLRQRDDGREIPATTL